MVSNKVVITIDGGIAEIRHFPYDIAVCINDLDAEAQDPCRRIGNRAASLATRWEYLCERVDHDCDLILRLAARKIRAIFPYYDNAHWRFESQPYELVINGELEWWFGTEGLSLCNMLIYLDTLESHDKFEFVQALMMDYEILIKEITEYGESYKQSRLASRGE